MKDDAQDRYQELLEANQHHLDEISNALQVRLSEWAHPDATLRVEWKQDSDKSVRVEEPWAHIQVGEGVFEGELARFGHGLQRSYVLALLQELAANNDPGGPKLILACEEPELYQHPPQARHLASVLENLSSDGTSQVIVSTHSPLFVSGQGFEDVRMVCKDMSSSSSSVKYMSHEDIAEAIAASTGNRPIKPEGQLARIHSALQTVISEMFFTRRLVLVEGIEDEAYLLSYFDLLGKSDEFRRLGCHIVRVNGKSQLLQPLAIAKHMAIPTYVVFDADANKSDKNGSRAKDAKDNKAILTLSGNPHETPMPDETVWGRDITMWHSDIGSIVADDIGSDWERIKVDAAMHFGSVGNLRKNVLHIGASLALAWEEGKKSCHLIRLCTRILNLAESTVVVQES